MATTANPPPGAFAVADTNGADPFVTNSSQDTQRHRYSAFDSSQFSFYSSGSPAQTKRALQAHLSETARRLQETSELGSALISQREALEQQLQEVEKQQEDGDIGPELRQRLAELEKEFNEVGRETARAFLPKSRVPSGEAPDSTAGASVYSGETQHSPSKVSVPSRRQRNQQPSRINDIALATDISTSLLSQIRELQALLREKDESLKAVSLEKSQFEIEVEGLSQRLRAIDESESRLKDVNWNLETQVRELEATSKDSADKEQRLTQNLNVARSEKSSLEREFEELKQIHAKLSEDLSVATKHHETELSGLRRNVSMAETERGALQRKIDDLASQNQELAKVAAYRLRSEQQGEGDDSSPDDGGDDRAILTPEHSPPPSPSKATPRHGQLESETLKHSLHHAHRMIQNLKNNIHREKTERIELKRMLQDARDELESKRDGGVNGVGSANKRKSKTDKDVFKKPARPDRLGAVRSGNQEIILDDEDWEEHDGQQTPSRRSRISDSVPGASPSGFSSAQDTSNEGFETATERSDAFETANEHDGTATETDAFHTGAETLDGDSTDDLTETEAGANDTIRGRRPAPLAIANKRNSYQSTASTSGDEVGDTDVKTPVQPRHQRFRVKMRQAFRSSPRVSAEMLANTPPAVRDSPSSLMSNSNNSTPAQGQSLFAELGNLSGESEDGSVADGTPSRASLLSPESSPEVMGKSSIGKSPLQSVSAPRLEMTDSSMMTEPWQPIPAAVPAYERSVSHIGTATDSPKPLAMSWSSISTQDTEPKTPVAGKIQPPPMHLSEISSLDTEPQESSVPTHAVKDFAAAPLIMSSINTQSTEPSESANPESTTAPLQVSSIAAQASEPVARAIETVPLHLSLITQQSTEPIEPPKPLSSQFTGIAVQHTEPVEPAKPAEFGPWSNRLSSVVSQEVQPESPTIPGFFPRPLSFDPPSRDLAETVATLSFSDVVAQEVEPQEPQESSRPATAHRTPAVMTTATTSAQTEAPVSQEGARSKVGFFSSVLPWSGNAADTTTRDRAVDTAQSPPSSKEGRMPLAPIAANAVQAERDVDVPLKTSQPQTVMTDGGTQTMVSAEQIDRLLVARSQRNSGTVIAGGRVSSPPASPKRIPHIATAVDPTKTPRRPGSAGSLRSRGGTPPPLPPDHKEVIAAAASKAPLISPPLATPGSMGPPSMPASAYKKRPQTPVRANSGGVATSPVSKSSVTPRPRFNTGRSDAASSMTRRSSVSSFASDIDHRFNPSRGPVGHEAFDPNTTDPRMIQAITQTMIGEFLWKYTRKAGREGMSENRHRRFFWVHPYTRTLYWSEKDPATAGRAQLKAKSVALQSVHEVTDDNPDPPGLHRKSIVMVTPGRTIKFTATTSQRHETWFNALSYLLLRTEEERDEQKVPTEDVREFNPAYSRSSSRQTRRSQASRVSYGRATSSPHRSPYPTLTKRQSSQLAISQTPDQGSSSGRLSSLSGVFRPGGTLRGSFSSRKSRLSVQQASTFEPSETHDSAEDLRKVIEQQERDANRLEMENVRACCDGKHDVGFLGHKHRHGSHNSRLSSFNSMSSRSHSRTGSYGPNSHVHHQNELQAANSGAGY